MYVCVDVWLHITVELVCIYLSIALKKELYVHEESSNHVLPAGKFDAEKHSGINGIQGHKNSCYLDAIIYGMFTFSDAFDILFLKEVDTNTEEYFLQNKLKSEIIYPLRK